MAKIFIKAYYVLKLFNSKYFEFIRGSISEILFTTLQIAIQEEF